MLASTFFDLCVGVDIHFEMVPMPAPVPTPFPHPFVGMVFDPLGLAAGLAIGAAIAAAVGAPPTGPVLINFMPATNVGTEAKNYLGVPHFIIPPGTMWTPMPKLPKPAFKGPPDPPGLPVAPEGDAICILGAQTVTVMGASAVRMGGLAMSCGEPVRLPSSVIIAIPKGAPVLIGGPSSVSLTDVIMALLRSKWVAGALHSLISRMKPGRLRNFLHRAVCFVTGHPVDVASGRVLSSAVDLRLPGPIPLVIERNYASSWARRSNTLGHGWHLSLDQAIWTERGRIVALVEDGRELEFDTFDLPGRHAQPGQRLYDPINHLELRVLAGGCYELEGRDGIVREFRPITSSHRQRVLWSRLSRISDHRGAHIELSYDKRGDLEWVRDSCGRWINLQYDAHGRCIGLNAPEPDAEGWFTHTRYRYDGAGDLVEVTDPLGRGWTMQYVQHLLVRETDRRGFSFYFAYDGVGQDAWCVRTWGDGGVYDHTLSYAKAQRKTEVVDSLGASTVYEMNEIGLVTKIIDACGAEVSYEYDGHSLALTKVIGPQGELTTFEYDARGNPTARVGPDGVRVEMRYEDGRLASVRDQRDGEWTFGIESRANDVTRSWRRNPAGELAHFERRGPYLVAAGQGERRIDLGYDNEGNVAQLRDASGNVRQFRYDRLGRVTAHVDERGRESRWTWDKAGRCIASEVVPGQIQRLEYDAEGNLIELRDPTRRVRFTYGGFRRCVARVEAGLEIRYGYDSENRLVSVNNEAGERWTFERDARGRLVGETSFDGRQYRYERDLAGRVAKQVSPGGLVRTSSYDVVGRLIEARGSDGSFRSFVYDPGGALVRATSDSFELEFELDALGRRQVERSERGWIEQQIGLHGERVGLSSSMGAAAKLGFDQTGKLTSFTFGSGGAQSAWVRYGSDADGTNRQLTSSGVEVISYHDEAGRPVAQECARVSADGARAVVEQTQWRWRGLDQVVAVSDAAGVRRYHHDERGALTGQAIDDGGQVRARDAVANVYERGDLQDRAYGAGGRLLHTSRGVSYHYDADGNRSEKLDAAGGRWQYHWDAFGQLRRVDAPDGRHIEMEYDALGRRVRQIVERVGDDDEIERLHERAWVWDGNCVLHELDGQELSTWYWAPDGLTLVGNETPAGRGHVVCDLLGTPTALFDAQTGKLGWRGRLDIYGRLELEHGEPLDCPFRWPGQQQDAETGDYYNRFRYYAPDEGLYLSPDPLGLFGGLRVYGYVADPLVSFDFFGLEDCYFEPMEVYFGQRRIAPTFASIGSDAPDYIRGRAILDVAEDLRLGNILPEDMMVDVFRHGDIYVAVNNRGLAALSLAGFQPTMGRIVTPEQAVINRLAEAPVHGFPALPSPTIPATVGARDDTVLWVVTIFGH